MYLFIYTTFDAVVHLTLWETRSVFPKAIVKTLPFDSKTLKLNIPDVDMGWLVCAGLSGP